MYSTAKTLLTPSRPITIPNVKEKVERTINDYELKLNFFNPDKFSPPNSWNSRLIHRLNSNRISKECS